MEDTQDLIFEIEGNVGSVGSSDLLGVVSLVMTGGTEALHLGKTSDSFEQQTGKKAKTVSRSLARTTTNIWETGNKKILRQVYSNHLPVERPTPKNFIIRLAEYLKRQTIRKQDTPLNGLERNETIPKEPNVHQKPQIRPVHYCCSRYVGHDYSAQHRDDHILLRNGCIGGQYVHGRNCSRHHAGCTDDCLCDFLRRKKSDP